VGDPDRADGRRRGRGRRGDRTQLNRRWWASAGDGAWTGKSLLRAARCQVSDVSRLEDASLSYSSMGGWDERGRLDDFLSLARRCWRTRAYGDFWSYMLLAEGAVDIAAEPELELHDMAALDVIVREAGGLFTSLEGEARPPRRQRAGHQRAAARPGARVPRSRCPTTPATWPGAAPVPCTSSAHGGDPRDDDAD
jgi:fructose-1,6-bisphosphatase/inositol monophosphatase family enzyme